MDMLFNSLFILTYRSYDIMIIMSKLFSGETCNRCVSLNSGIMFGLKAFQIDEKLVQDWKHDFHHIR